MARSAHEHTDTHVAKETLAYCTSCKMDLNHVIVAMKGDRIAKVQCLTCKKEHSYKAAKGVSEPVVTPKSKKKPNEKSKELNSTTSIHSEWEGLMALHKDAVVKTYTPQGYFTLGDRLNHPIFGEGIVGRLIYPNKLEVVFKNEMKILIYSGSPGPHPPL